MYELSGVVLVSGSWVGELSVSLSVLTGELTVASGCMDTEDSLSVSSSVLTGELTVASGCLDTEDSRISTRFRGLPSGRQWITNVYERLRTDPERPSAGVLHVGQSYVSAPPGARADAGNADHPLASC